MKMHIKNLQKKQRKKVINTFFNPISYDLYDCNRTKNVKQILCAILFFSNSS